MSDNLNVSPIKNFILLYSVQSVLEYTNVIQMDLFSRQTNRGITHLGRMYEPRRHFQKNLNGKVGGEEAGGKQMKR